jgi:SMC interacting uncharacterized protein involved in chromosome segregation
LSENAKESIAKSLNFILSNIDPLTIKINVAIQVFNEFNESVENDIEKYRSTVDQVIKEIIADKNCSDNLKINIEVYNNMDLKQRCAQIN